ncbi:putative permease [Phaeobacter piscinae]|uniref:Permease n=1 Tax=Phaeobacter piscinae TaxID=1580596 RepID=A0ABM6PFM3_9RHOB|nr:AI-2E family transporter [Phaeobacter piscinae]ATG36583.1 putative permease [Phaeobacter piscinae]AUQ87104.1 putative permease [Phaeobacter piscinae]AUR24987.1 putative permease [Phaeobacter piscinae]
MLNSMLSDRAARIMLLILTALALGLALFVSKSVLAPAIFAMVVGIVVSPLADRLQGDGIARVIVAASLLLFSCAIIVLLFLSLEPLISGVVEELPKIKREIKSWVYMLSGLLRGIEAISEEIEQTVGTGAASADVTTGFPTLMDALWVAPNFGAQVFIFIGTLFFFVLTRTDIYAAAGSLGQRLYRAEHEVARYFAAVTLVNAGLGVATAIGLAALGIDSPLIWGLAAMLLNFILYLGPLMMIAGLTFVGMTQFGGAAALMPPALFLTLNLIEAQFVTPAFVGHQLHLSPLVVFLAIVFGLWIWGPVGAIVALPVLLWIGQLLRSSAEARMSSGGKNEVG